MNCCYILFSEKLNKFYIGACHENLADRIIKHNEHSHGNHRFTSTAHDWKLFLEIPCDSYSTATKISNLTGFKAC